MKCEQCGIGESERRIIKSPKYGTLCSVCYQRVKSSSTVYTKPPYGEVGYDPEGKPICHICGRSYKKLISHVIQQHKMSQDEYKIKFGLDLGAGIMCEESKSLARKRNKEHFDKVVKKNLLEGGKKTRFGGNNPPPPTRYFSEQSKKQFMENRYNNSIKKKEEDK